MKVKLIIPGWPKTSVWGTLFRFPYLSLTTLAAVTPEGWEVCIEDENVAPLDFGGDADLVGITALTPLAPRAYEIAAEHRRRGRKVVLGGHHATWRSEEALGHVDAVVAGEAEGSWPKLLADFQAGRLQRIYKAEPASAFPTIGPARRELLNRKKYLFLNTLQTTRGCPFDCEFCAVTPFYGHTYRTRPLEEVERDLATLSGGANFLFIVDDNVVGNPGYAKQLFELLKRYPFKWLSQASITLAENAPLMKLAQESGCIGMFVGFESLSQEALDRVNKRWGKVDRYAEAIKKLHDYGIGIQGSFIFGYDWDTERSFDEVLEFAIRNRLDSVLFTILTPFPGTRVYDSLKAEGRILHSDWSRYDMSHAVYRPRNFSPEELEDRFLRANRAFHSMGSIFHRLRFVDRGIPVWAPMNMGFRGAWKKFDPRAGGQEVIRREGE